MLLKLEPFFLKDGEFTFGEECTSGPYPKQRKAQAHGALLSRRFARAWSA
jgi:hypothetical protein